MFKTGLVGTIVAAICCFTPVLVWLLPAIGLAGWLSWIDFPLYVALVLFGALAVVGFARRTRAAALRENN